MAREALAAAEAAGARLLNADRLSAALVWIRDRARDRTAPIAPAKLAEIELRADGALAGVEAPADLRAALTDLIVEVRAVLRGDHPHDAECPTNNGEAAARCRCWHRDLQTAITNATRTL